MGIIYKLTAPHGKVYIGQSIRRSRKGKIIGAKKQLQKRWREHCQNTSGCHALHNAIVKYGATNFKREVLIEAPDETLDELECGFIDLFASNKRKFGYNRTPGGVGQSGFTMPHVRKAMQQPGSKWMESHKRPGVTARKQRNIHSAEAMAKKKATFDTKFEARLAKLPPEDREKCRQKALKQREATARWRTAHECDGKRLKKLSAERVSQVEHLGVVISDDDSTQAVLSSSRSEDGIVLCTHPLSRSVEMQSNTLELILNNGTTTCNAMERSISSSLRPISPSLVRFPA